MDDRDRFRFIHDLFEFNDETPADNSSYRFSQRNPTKPIVIARRYVGDKKIKREPRKLLVEILAFCLMPNHYHLLLRPLAENGISRFMKKVNMGYCRYFNERHERTGTLFEGRFKSVLVDSQAHFIHLPYYIHLNALDLVAPEWRQRRIENLDKAMNFLNIYRWSSHLDYVGENNFSSVTQRDFLLEIFEGEKGYKKKMKEWLRGLNIRKIRGFVME